MNRRIFSLVITLLGAVWVPISRADSEYWVSVGSYRTYAEAETAREKAGARLPESFSIAEAELDSGLWYRVQSGPYLSKDIADHLVDEARRQGFTSPWVLMRKTTLAGPLEGYPAGLLEPEPVSAGAIDLERSGLDLPDSEPMDVPGFNAPIPAESEADHTLVSEAPAGYRLNRLHRN